MLLALFGTLSALVRRERPRLFRQGLVWSAVACLWLLVAFVAAHVLESRRLLMLQPARATDLWICFAAPALACIAAGGVERASDSRSRLAWMLALGAVFLVWLPPGAWVAALLLASAALPPVWRAVAPRVSPRRIAWLLVAWVALWTLVLLGYRWSYSDRLADLVLVGPDAAMREVADWAEAHTPVDSVFLVNPGDNPDFNQFMGLSGRSIFTNWEEGTALYFAPEFVPEWTERLRALGFEIRHHIHGSSRDRLNDLFRRLRDEDVARLATRYRLRYWIVPPGQPSRFPVAFDTEDYRVLEVW